MSAGIECPNCGRRASQVTDSRPREDPVPHIHRRRSCNCGHRYGTREFLDDVGFARFIDGNGLSGRDRVVVEALIAKMIEAQQQREMFDADQS